MDFGNVFTAFAVPLLGLFLSICFFLLEKITFKFGCCKKAINAYNYRINKNEDDEATQAKAQELVGEISELLKTSRSQDIKELLSYLRTSAFMSFVYDSTYIPKFTYDQSQHDK